MRVAKSFHVVAIIDIIFIVKVKKDAQEHTWGCQFWVGDIEGGVWGGRSLGRGGISAG